jgi:hypothetical protein
LVILVLFECLADIGGHRSLEEPEAASATTVDFSRVSGDLLFGNLETLAVVCWHVIALFWLSSSSAFVCIFVQVLGAVIIRDVIGLGDEGMAASGEKGEDAWDLTIDLVLPVYISSGWTNS